MFESSYLQNEAQQEAEDIISSWITTKECAHLTGLDIDAGEYLGENNYSNGPSSSSLSSLLGGSSRGEQPEDESDAVMKRLNSCLSFDKKDLLKEKVVKPSFVRPIITMEIRHQRVKEARRKRQEESEKRHNLLMQKQQMRKAAEDIVKQEVKEEQMRRKMEEDAILMEMNRIRKIVQDQRRAVAKAQVVVEKENKQAEDGSDAGHKHDVEQPARSHDKVSFVNKISIDRTYLVEKLCQKQRRKLMKKCLVTWYKVVLDRKSALGKAKALAEWNSTMKVWNAWRKYTIVQSSNRSLKHHETNLKQTKLQEHLADLKYNKVILRRYFKTWMTYVKANVYSKNIWKAHETTKAKMEALVGAIVKDKQPKEDDLVVECLDDSSYPPSVVEDTPSQFSSVRRTHLTPKCKPAWQVTKADVKKLSKSEMLQLQPHLQNPKKINKPNNTKPCVDDDNFQHPLEVIDKIKKVQIPQKKLLKEQISKTHKKEYVPRPKVLTEMEKRAVERSRRRQEMNERRKEKEREKIELEEQEEEERINQEKEEKKRKIQEAQEIKRIKEQQIKEKQAFLVRMRELRVVADQHYKVNLLRKCGLEPWKKFVSSIRQIQLIAVSHFYKHETEKCFYNWLSAFRKSRSDKETLADNLQIFLTKKHAFKQWLAYGEIVSIQEKKADLHFSHLVKRRYLIGWKIFTTNQQLEMFRKVENAVYHNKTRLLKMGFHQFVKHQQFIAREKDRSKHVSDMRRKITELLPDFCPEES